AGLRDYYNLSIENIAFISLWFSVSSFIFQIPAGYIADKIGKRISLIMSEICGICYFSCIIAGFIVWNMGFNLVLLFLIIGEFFMGICVSLFIPSEGMTVTDLDETGKRKAESLGIVSLIRGIGYIPTGIIAGFLIEYVNYITPNVRVRILFAVIVKINPIMRGGMLKTNIFFRPYRSDNLPINGFEKANKMKPNVDKTPVMNIEPVKASMNG
ncbi:unnamed protein product, partial [marine sediment metagenome]